MYNTVCKSRNKETNLETRNWHYKVTYRKMWIYGVRSRMMGGGGGLPSSEYVGTESAMSNHAERATQSGLRHLK